jgi:serine/threonine protein kinase
MAEPVQPSPDDRGDDSDPAAASSTGEGPPPKAAEPTHFYNAETDDGADGLPGIEFAGSGDWLQSTPQHFGKYTIEGSIGHGGMGVVWKAHDPDLNRTVAIKVLAPHLAQSRTARHRFQREARAAAAISHPHVLTIHAVEAENQTPFLVMEYVSGGSLKEFVAARGKLSPVQAIQLSCQIAQGLAAAHAQGVIHRDVKPGNVMLHEGGVRVRLADFGLARVASDNSELTSHDQTVGTPAYMAPEQLRGDRIDARADLFSLGCVMHFMLVGHSPFQGRTQGETIHKILGETPRPLLEIDPSIPPALAEIVDRLLRKDPDERYQSAYEVASVLERYLTLLNQAPTDEIANILGRNRQHSGAPGAGAGRRRQHDRRAAGAQEDVLDRKHPGGSSGPGHHAVYRAASAGQRRWGVAARGRRGWTAGHGNAHAADPDGSTGRDRRFSHARRRAGRGAERGHRACD